MSRFLLTSELGRGYGHSTRLANIAEALVESGHDVVVASRHARHVAKICKRKVVFAAIPLPINCNQLAPTYSYYDIAAAAGLADVSTTNSLVRNWHRIMLDERIDFVVAEHAPASILAARLARLPTAHIGSGFIVPPLPLSANLAPWLSLPPHIPKSPIDQIIQEVARTMGDNLSGLDNLLSYPSRHLLTFSELDHFAVRSINYYGSLEPRHERSLGQSLWPSRRRKLFVYLPLNHHIHSVVREVAEKSNWSVIWHDPSVKCDQSADGVRYSALPVARDTILQADAIISRGGHGLSTQAMLSAIPHIVLPDRSESALLARRLIHQSFAQTLPPTARPNDLQIELDRCCFGSVMKSSLKNVAAKYCAYSAEEMRSEFVSAISRG